MGFAPQQVCIGFQSQLCLGPRQSGGAEGEMNTLKRRDLTQIEMFILLQVELAL